MARRFDKLLQFKIKLDDIHPPIWRRIQVPSSYSFWDLHVAIQDAMGWLDCHLHAFRIANPEHGEEEQIGIPADDSPGNGIEFLPGWDLPIEAYFSEPGDSAAYEYDFGDGWEHDIVLEQTIPREPKVKYPRCTAGARACPPEDCGGVPGYERLLEILADPEQEQHDEMSAWVGGVYDPERFDPAQVRFDNPQKRWETAFGPR